MGLSFVAASRHYVFSRVPDSFILVDYLFSSALAVSLALPIPPLLVIFQVTVILIAIVRMDWIIGSIRSFLGRRPHPRLSCGLENPLPITLPTIHDYDHYDVFLNHRGPDVKGTFAAHLEDALICAGFHPFLDKRSVKKGDHALIAIDHGLNASDVHVAIVSRRYAESKYCLTELVAMLASKKPIIPVFYDVEPQHLRHELFTGPFKSAFEEHKRKGRNKEVEQWAEALGKLGGLMAFRLADYKGDEAKLKHDILDEVKRLLPSNMQVPVGKYRVGLKSSTLLCINELEKMGPSTGAMCLFGMGGVGKTTLSEGIYNYYAYMKKYPSMAFLRDVRSAFSEVEVGRKGHLIELQNQLLWDLLRVKDTSPREYNFWYQKLSSRGPFFIVLDNIDSKDQFEKLIPDMNLLGQGSRVILTSRDKSMLSVIPAKFLTFQHAVKPLECYASQRLFNWHAFGMETEPEEFRDLATNVANACHGLPLALKVMGSSLAGKGTIEDRHTIWSEAVEYLKENADVMRILQWSYDCLPSKSEKLMFQDIACTIHRIDKPSAMACWEACKHCTVCPGFRNPHSSLQCLFEKCLVEEDARHCLIIHDLLQDMAKKTVREQSEDPREHSHQFDVQVAEQIVAENDGTKHIRSLTLTGSKRKFSAEEFGKMERLHYLVVDGCEVSGDFKRFPKRLRYLQWRAMPYAQIPTTLDVSSLSVLDLSESSTLVNLWSNSKLPMQNLFRLRTLKMSSCSSITALPESIKDLCMLDKLDLDNCTRLSNLPESIGQLKELRHLNLNSCESLELLPSNIGVLTNLKLLTMGSCKQLKSLPDSFGKLSSLLDLSITQNSTLTELPESLGNLLNLKRLDLTMCSGLKYESFPDTLCKLTALREVEFGSCTSLLEIPAFLEELSDLDFLGLDNCNLDIDCPDSFSGNTGLKMLCIMNNSVTCFPELVRRLPQLEEIRVSDDCADFTDVPDDFMIRPLAPGLQETVIRREKLSYFSLDTVDSAALPTD